MSKHFNYDYREVLTETLGKKYKQELILLGASRRKQSQLDNVQSMIEDYFSSLEENLKDVIVVLDGEIEIITKDDMFLRITMFKNYLKFTRFDHAIEVEIGIYDSLEDIVEAKINSNIIPSEKRCVVKKIGKVHDGSHFDEKTINYFMNEAFGALKELSNE